jgi:hypothetical protein
MNPLFDIKAGELDEDIYAKSTLWVELNESRFTAVWMNRKQPQLFRLLQFQLDQEAEKPLSDQIQEIIQMENAFQFLSSDVIVVYNFTECHLLPAEHYSLEVSKSMTDLLMGNAVKGLVLSEKVEKWDLYTLYRVNRDMHTLMQRSFKSSKYWHLHSLMLKSVIPVKSTEEVILKLHFYPGRVVVCLYRGKSLYLLRSFAFEHPEDVSWYILSALNSFNISPFEVTIRIAGMIEMDSLLFVEITKYFELVEWDEIDFKLWMNEELGEYPAHYFSPLLQMALCV